MLKANQKKGQVPFTKVLKRHWLLLVMLLPAVIYVVIFSYIPMTGIIMAFEKYTFKGGIYRSPWVGLNNFRALMLSGKLWMVTRNTILYNVAFIFLGIVFEVGSAILLNELGSKLFKKVAQSLMFLPYFISWVVAGAIMYNIFNYEKGVFNHLLQLIHVAPLDVYNTPAAWPFILIFLKLWKSVGYGSVIYLAAITGLDQEMFEAASIDGASAWQKIRYLTIPSLVPTIMTMTLLAIGNIFRGDFGLFYQTVKSSAILQPTTEIIDTYIFKLLIGTGDVGVSAASGLYQSVFCFITITVVNGIVKKLNSDYALF
ncbi:MAG: ABC transporter permease subunit [Lachnospiraceae bacterium]|nr:ABC transporter permease subunit [Lachnospiraceae bacterium]